MASDKRRLEQARAAYLSGDWDALEIALDIAQPTGDRVKVEELMRTAQPKEADDDR